MVGYLIRRLCVAVIVVFGIAFFSFLLLHWCFPKPGRIALGSHTPQVSVNAWNKAHGYDRPFIIQFFSYIGQICQGNLGYSYAANKSVLLEFKEYTMRSVYLSGASTALAVLIAIPLGIWQAVKRNTVGDYVLTGTTLALYSFPSFFLGLVLMEIFAIKLHWLDALVPSGMNSTWQAISSPKATLLPILTLTGIVVAGYSRYMRSAALDNMAQDYIRLARAKGLPERLVLARHLAKNSILPMVTLIGLSIPGLLAGNLLIEELFNYPGLGYMFYNALTGKPDYPTLMGYVLIGGVLTVLGNLFADIASTVADPRIRL